MSEIVSTYINSIFEQPWWLDAVSPKCWDEILIKEDDEVIARFPYCFTIAHGKRNIVMPALTQTCGIWMKETVQKTGNEHLSRQKDIIDEIVKKLPECKSFKVFLDSSVKYFLPFIWQGYKVVPRVSYRLSDLSDINAIYANFSKTVKKNIKSASKKVIIDKTPSVDILMDMMEKTFAAQGRKYPVSRNVIERIVEAAEKHHAGKMYTAVDLEGNIHACSYFVYDENVCYYLIAGSDVNYRTSGAQTLILWEAIQDAANVSKSFDFEGSMVEGIETFFRRFGGDPIIYYEVSKQSLIDEIKDILKPRIKRIIGYK